MLCVFREPVDPVFQMWDVPHGLVVACRSLDKRVMHLERALEFLREASRGLGTVTVEDGCLSEDGYISIEVRLGPTISDELLVEFAENADGASDAQAGMFADKDGSRPMSAREVRQRLQALQEQGEGKAYAVLIRFSPVKPGRSQ